MMAIEKSVKVGVGLYILNSNHQLLLGLRKSIHGNGTWCPPGGHLEYGESFEQAAVREAKEETGLTVTASDTSVMGVTNDFFKESGKHYITIHLLAKKFGGTPAVCEQDKCVKWQWFDLNNLPDNLFLPAAQFLNNHTLF